MSDLLKVRVGGNSYLCKWEPADGDYDYSEHKIGTWIDGNDVYRRVVLSNYNVTANEWSKVILDPSIKQVLSCTAITSYDAPQPDFIINPQVKIKDGYVELYAYTLNLYEGDKIILEYTKNEV